MFDPLLKRLAAPALAKAAAPLAPLGADLVSLAGFAVGLAVIPAVARHAYLAGLGLLLLNRLVDALDGAVARQTRATGRGAFLDMTLDLIVFCGVPFGFALADPSHALAAVFLVFAIAASGAAAVFLNAQGWTIAGFIGRAMGDTELTLAFAVACLWPDAFGLIAYIAGALCFLTAGGRIALAWDREP
ncbi:MAG TPA: CDP-alcohol phosphatidyltransferase family protein [Rhizomicrobium sp.]|jgi:phosphatidylglycerophosphate synthase